MFAHMIDFGDSAGSKRSEYNETDDLRQIIEYHRYLIARLEEERQVLLSAGKNPDDSLPLLERALMLQVFRKDLEKWSGILRQKEGRSKHGPQ